MWICITYCLCLLGANYFFCSDVSCEFNSVLIQLVRVLTVIGILFFLFLSSMLMNVTYGIMTGIGTIDRMKKKANNTMNFSVEEPIHLKDVFGIAPYWQWIIPCDPVFEDDEVVMGWRL